jgi:hypothetical protein
VPTDGIVRLYLPRHLPRFLPEIHLPAYRQRSVFSRVVRLERMANAIVIVKPETILAGTVSGFRLSFLIRP